MAVAAARRAVEEADLQQVGLVDVLDRVGLLADRGRQRVHAHRAAAELLDDREQQLAVDLVEAVGVDLEQRQRVVGHRRGDGAVGAHLGEVAHAAQQAVRDARRAAAAAGDLAGAVVVDRDAEDAGGAGDDEVRRSASV